MFLKKMNRFLSRIPVSIRVTVWFSSVIVILFLIILSSLILIEDKVVNDLSQKELVEAVEEIYEDPEKFENFNDGIYYIKYNEQNEIIAGKFPKDFDIALAFSIEDINIYQVENKKFLYYDTRLQDEDDWIRGIYPLGKVQKEIETLWNIAIALSVLFLIFVVIVGYRIIKNAFKPVKQISDTALKIKRSKDFSNRIELEDSNDDEIHKMASTFNEMLDTVEEVFIHEKQFSSDVSHELRTPITVILAQSDYALQYSDTFEEAKESLEVINRHAKRMTNLINQIMELSKLERQKEIEKEKINLSNIVLQLLEDYKPLLESKNLNLIYNVEKDIRIQGNKIMLERVFLNILMNAVKFTKTNIEVSLTREGKTAVLKIRDDGIGISEENKKFIWERFYQVNDSRNKEENKGSGLGLSMVKKIVDLHSATIDLESEIEQGTCFTIKFNMQ
jgi:sensor histidine kinase